MKFFRLNFDQDYLLQMSKVTIPRGLRSVRHYMNLPLLLIPNEQKHLFESEKLTPLQNKAAIPSKPPVENLVKYHHEIPRPDYIADIITRPLLNDVLVTVLANKSPFMGDPEHALVSTDPTKATSVANLQFTSIVTEWIQLFNKQIVNLQDLDVTDSPFTFSNKVVDEKIQKKYDSLVDSEASSSIYTPESLHSLYKSLKSFENSEKKLQGLFPPTELAQAVTFEYLSCFLARTDEVRQNADSFESLIAFIEENIKYSSGQGLKEIMVQLIDNLYDSKVSSLQTKLSVFNDFTQAVGELSESSISELDPIRLDKLAFLFTMARNLEKSSNILKILIHKHQICPTTETMNAFLSTYDEMFTGGNTDGMLRDLSVLKPAFFHNGLTLTSFNILLKHVVRDITDLTQFLSLAESTERGMKALTKSQSSIVLKLMEIQQGSSESDKHIQLSMLLRRLVVENSITLSPETTNLLNERYPSICEGII